MLFDIRCEIAGGFKEDWTIPGTDDAKNNLSAMGAARLIAENRIRKHYPEAKVEWCGLVAFVNRPIPLRGPMPKMCVWTPPVGPRSHPLTWRHWTGIGGPEARTPRTGWALLPMG